MRVVIAPDAFKGGPDGLKIAQAMARGVFGAGASAKLLPMADGGEGTADVIRAFSGQGERVPVDIVDAFGRPAKGHYDRIGAMAVVEAAVGSGFIEASQRPSTVEATTSLGTGQLVQRALADPQVAEVVVALGGTGCVDGGLGLLEGIGWQFYDGAGRRLPPMTRSLAEVREALPSTLVKPLVGWWDVSVPLLGELGSVRGFGPQKGIRSEDLERMEAAMASFGRVLQEQSLREGLVEISGAGAAGGMGMAISAAGGHLRPGAEQVAQFIGLDEHLAHADLAMTGEGRLDAQTKAGKVVATVAAHAHRLNVPTVVLAGSIDLASPSWLSSLNAYAFSIVPGPMALEHAMADTERLVQAQAFTVMTLLERIRFH